MPWWLIVIFVVVGLLVVLLVHDLTQKRHAILRNFPIVGHIRYGLEKVGPELRQYIVADDNEERPFSRDQRRWVYATAKNENPYFAFGTDNDLDTPGTVIIKHSAFPLAGAQDHTPVVVAPKVLGGWRKRPGAFRPASIVNISGMSFGSLSGPAVEALNRGAAQSGCLHNTGEGGISPHHRHGGDLIFQIGTGLFGARDDDGNFSMERMLESVRSAPVKAIELKLSQGAKPGIGGLLPAKKVTKEIAEARGVPVGVTVASPSSHNSFHDVPGLIDFVESIAEATGLPVGIKSAVGQMDFWEALAAQMRATGRGPDFITIDGGEGGTGAGPLVFTDNVAYPFRVGFAKVYATFKAENLHRDIVFMGAGKLGYPQSALAAMALGCDMINVGREAMLAVGCIQAQKCHTGHCPTGVATQQKWFMRGLDPLNKGNRAGNYIVALRYDLQRVAHAGGVHHPSLLPITALEIVEPNGTIVPIAEHYGLSTETRRYHDADIDVLNATAAS